MVYDFLCSFKDIDESNTVTKQKMIDLFVNRVILFDNGTITIYYNATDDKGKQLKISVTPDVSKEIEYIESKKKITQTLRVRIILIWWTLGGSNPRPTD